jgi:hypothetical protein
VIETTINGLVNNMHEPSILAAAALVTRVQVARIKIK